MKLPGNVTTGNQQALSQQSEVNNQLDVLQNINTKASAVVG